MLLALPLLLALAEAAPRPAPGDVAPDITLAASDGRSLTLSSLRGKKVVLAFFPKAFTSG